MSCQCVTDVVVAEGLRVNKSQLHAAKTVLMAAADTMGNLSAGCGVVAALMCHVCVCVVCVWGWGLGGLYKGWSTMHVHQ